MSSDSHLRALRAKIKRSRGLLKRQHELFHKKEVLVTELEAIYEVCFLNIFISFENELAELLITNLMMDFGTNGRRRSLFVPSSRAAASRLVFGDGGKPPFQMLPLDNLAQTASYFLKDGFPFTVLDEKLKGEIKKAYAIRNHIAHRSSSSKKRFLSSVMSQASLPKNSSVPGFYLKSNMTKTVTYFDHHVSKIGLCLKELCEKT